MPDQRTKLGSEAWRTSFERRVRERARLGRLTHFRNVAPGQPTFVGGNVSLFLHDGQVQLAWMLAAIGRAERRVDLETYIFSPDATGLAIRDALAAAAQRGVVVRLLYDSIGSSAAPRDFFAPIVEAGGHVVEFHPVAPWRLRVGRVGRIQAWEPNRRDHRKLLVCDAPSTWVTSGSTDPRPPTPAEGPTDGAIAILGGRNVGDEYLGRPLGDGQWRDSGAILSGPVVTELAAAFDAMWFHAEGEDALAPELRAPATGDVFVLPLGSQPGFFNVLQWAMSRLAGAVQEELRVSSAYFIPSARWRRALASVARRTPGGCRVLVPKVSDVPVVDAAGRHLWGGLLVAGVRIHRYAEDVLHEKTLVYDRVVTVLGSSNLDPRSFRHNYELSVVVVCPRFAAVVAERHERAHASCEPYTLDMWRARTLAERLQDWFWSLFRAQL